jgi:hypothetical protein
MASDEYKEGSVQGMRSRRITALAQEDAPRL